MSAPAPAAINAAGFALLKEAEGCRLSAYQDGAGVWTIGYGHTGPGVREGLVWTQLQAEAALMQDVAIAAAGVGHLLDLSRLTANQIAALIVLVFNVGVAAFGASHLRRCIAAGDAEGTRREWLDFCHINGQVNPGLLARRNREVALWETV